MTHPTTRSPRTAPRSRRHRAVRAGLLGAAAAAALAVPATLPAEAKDLGKSIHPVTLHLESLSVGNGTEFRMLAVHPVFRPKDIAAPPTIRLASAAAPDAIGIIRKSASKASRLALQNLLGDPTTLLPGEIIRSEDADYMVTRHVLVPAGETGDLEVTRISRDAPRDEVRTERAPLQSIVPAGLRFIGQVDPGSKRLRTALADWAELASAGDGRRSPAQFAQTRLIADRVQEYVQRLAELPRTPPAMELVGYAGVIDGRVAAIETWQSNRLFGQAWARALTALAVEASIEEIRQEVLTEEIAESTEPDRFIAAVKETMLQLYAIRPKIRRAKTSGSTYSFADSAGVIAESLVRDERVLHLVILTDPDVEAADADENEFDPGVAERKARPTEEEKRLLERRRRRNPPIPPTPPPTPPPGGGGGGGQ